MLLVLFIFRASSERPGILGPLGNALELHYCTSCYPEAELCLGQPKAIQAKLEREEACAMDLVWQALTPMMSLLAHISFSVVIAPWPILPI